MPIFPFSSQKKDMSTILRTAEGYMLYVKGNPEKIMNLSVNLSDEEKNALEEKITSFQSAQDVSLLLHIKTGSVHRGRNTGRTGNRPDL